MRVLILSSSYPSPADPVAARFVRDHVHAAALRDEVVVVALVPVPLASLGGRFRLVERETDRGVPTVRVYLPSVPVLRELVLALVGLPVALAVACRRRPDVLHVVAALPAAPLALVLGPLLRVPTVVSEYMNPFAAYMRGPVRRGLVRALYRRARVVLVASRFSQRQLEEWGIAGPFEVLANVVDVAAFRAADERAVHRPAQALYVGRLSAEKGVPLLLQALTRLSPGTVSLAVAGDGPERAAYERLARELELDGVVFHGLQSHEGVAALMREADFLVLPSLTENQPCVVLEAQACGLPVLATATGGVPEIVPPASGVLVRPGDVDALAAGFAELLGRLAELRPRGIAEAVAAGHSPAAVGAALGAVYREARAPDARRGGAARRGP